MDLDGFRVGPGGDQKAGAGVAQIVDPETFGECGLLDGLVPDLAPEVAVAQRCNLRCGEDERIGTIGELSSEMLGEAVTKEPGDTNDAAPMVLRRAVVELAAGLRHRFDDLDPGSREIATPPFQGCCFAPPV